MKGRRAPKAVEWKRGIGEARRRRNGTHVHRVKSKQRHNTQFTVHSIAHQSKDREYMFPASLRGLIKESLFKTGHL